MKKVVEIVCGLQNGGVESLLYNYLKNIDRNEFDIDIITHGSSNPDTKLKFEELGCNIIEITPKKKSIIKNIKELYKNLKNGNYNVIHCHMSINNALPLFIAKILKIPNRISHSHQAIVKSNLLKKIYSVVCRNIIKISANSYVACGEEAAMYLYGDKYFERGRVKILNNAIDLRKFKFNEDIRNKIRKKYKVKDNEVLLGHVGRFSFQKNHMFLVELLKNLDVNRFKLLLIGDGELKNEIVEKVKESRLFDNVIFLENVNNVNELLSAMDIFLLPSRFEGLPVVGIEAQANGIKCIFSNLIDNKLKIADNVKFLPLNIKQWKEECENVDEYKRVENEELLKGKGYDICQQTKEFINIYNKEME